MNRIANYASALIHTLQEINLLRLILAVLLLVVLGAIGLWIAEPQVDITNALWWSIVTLTTVGYGDLYPTTAGGRLVGAVLMVLGIGVLGAFTGQLASLLTERRRLKDKGLLVDVNLSGHIIFSDWSPRAASVFGTLRSDERGRTRSVVLIAELEESPFPDDPNFIFIRGKTNEANLRRANLDTAETVVAFGDPALDEEGRDAKVVLHLLTIESLNPAVHTIAEVEQRSTVAHCRRAKADEVIIGGEFTSHLLSRASIDHGISGVLSELVDPRTGTEIFKVPLPSNYVGTAFGDVLQDVKQNYDCLVIGIEARDDGGPRVFTNPSLRRTLRASDMLVVLGEEESSELRR
jgi:voltage-gated potassium channel